MPSGPSSSLPSPASYLPKKRLQFVRPATIVSAALNTRVKASASPSIAVAGIPSIFESFHVVPSSVASAAPPQQAVIAAKARAATKSFFIRQLIFKSFIFPFGAEKLRIRTPSGIRGTKVDKESVISKKNRITNRLEKSPAIRIPEIGRRDPGRHGSGRTGTDGTGLNCVDCGRKGCRTEPSSSAGNPATGG